MLKICIWMNVKTHHQSAFFEALAADARFDLQVRYFEPVPQELLQKGYQTGCDYTPYEKSVWQCSSPQEMLATLPDWRERIHVTGYSFCPGLVHHLVRERVRWCQWSERYGYRLFNQLKCSLFWWRLISPFYFLLKRHEGKFFDRTACRVFGQGKLSFDDFRKLGVDPAKCRPLFYAPAPLPEGPTPPELTAWCQGKNVFVYVGTLSRRKATDCLLKAFSRVPDERAALLLIGPDSKEADYRGLAEKLAIADRVRFTGTVKTGEIPSCLQLADVLILPSRFDGWGAVLNEAASLGKALISTDQVGAAWHLIHPGENGFRVKAGSVSALTRAMQEYAADPGLAKRHGACSKKLYFAEFTPQCNVERLWKALQE